MTYYEYRVMHKNNLRVNRIRFEFNPLPSATDPTQDVPVSKIQFGLNGEPINVKSNVLPYNNLPIEKMSSIDRRNNDVFDQVGELRKLEKSVKQS